MKTYGRLVKSTITLSLALIAAITLFSAVIGSIINGRFTLRYIFPANFTAAAVIIASGVLLYMLPVRLKNSKLIDHSTFGPVYAQAKEKRLEKSKEVLYLGLCNIILTAIIQYILSLILV